MKELLILFFVYFNFGSDALRYTPLLNIPQGELRGIENNEGTFRKYLGIPYSTVFGRFEGPGPPPHWLGTLDAIYTSRLCPQYHEQQQLPIGDENCLQLNVFTPGTISKNKLLPVMMFIHGETFMQGSNNEHIYNPEPLVNKEVIIVTINYRLGAFGFLCLKIKGASGNAGLKDQIAALFWIKTNIHFFGGNPNMITIAGIGAGSQSVNYLMLSPEAAGLFNAAIMQSGSALSSTAFASNPIETASKVASKMGYKTKNPYELLEIYRKSSKLDIIMASRAVVNANPFSNFVFRPCAEKQLQGERPFITMTPKEILESGNYIKVPSIIGYNDKDAATYTEKINTSSLPWLDIYFDTIMPENLNFTNYEELETVKYYIKTFYFGNEGVKKMNKENLTNYFSDILFQSPSVLLTHYLLQNCDLPVFNYNFQYVSRRNYGQSVLGMKGVNWTIYGDELVYLFKPIIVWSLPLSSDDKRIIEVMTKMWKNFAKFGNPTPSRTPLMPYQWEVSKNNDLQYLVINKEIKMSSLPNPERMEFWKHLYTRYGI